MNNQITFDDKVALNDNPLIPDINKCKADDMNEIKNKHNGCMNGSIPMGNVVVDSIRSKNVLNYRISNSTNYGIELSMDSTQLKLNGTTTGAGLIYYATSNTFKLKAGTYTISSSILSGSFTRNGQDIGIYVRNETTNTIIFSTIGAQNYANNSTITLNDDTPIIIYLNSGGSGFVASNLIIGLQIEEGNIATSYSPYQNLNAGVYKEIQLTPSDTTNFEGNVTLRKYGKVVTMESNTLGIKNMAANTWADIITIPDEFTPWGNTEVRGIGFCETLPINAVVTNHNSLSITPRGNAITNKLIYINMTWITNK